MNGLSVFNLIFTLHERDIKYRRRLHWECSRDSVKRNKLSLLREKTWLNREPSNWLEFYLLHCFFVFVFLEEENKLLVRICIFTTNKKTVIYQKLMYIKNYIWIVQCSAQFWCFVSKLTQFVSTTFRSNTAATHILYLLSIKPRSKYIFSNSLLRWWSVQNEIPYVSHII